MKEGSEIMQSHEIEVVHHGQIKCLTHFSMLDCYQWNRLMKLVLSGLDFLVATHSTSLSTW